jgi:DNA-binding XRE family transcriptional regulator
MKKKKDRNVVGPMIRQYRINSGLTQRELAVKCQLKGLDITRDTLAQIESQFRGVLDKEVVTFAKVLKTTVSSLYKEG